MAAAALTMACGPTGAQKPAEPSEEKPQAFGAEYIRMVADASIPVGQSKRPPVEQRLFQSQVIDQKIEKVKQQLSGNPYLAWMFENCFPNTLETTAHYTRLPNGDDDTFVYTGDIAAMWLRDSGAQVWPYVQFCNDDPALARLIRGVILRQLKSINRDPYANAFYRDTTQVGPWQSDHTDMKIRNRLTVLPHPPGLPLLEDDGRHHCLQRRVAQGRRQHPRRLPFPAA